MAETHMSDLIRTSLDGIRAFTGNDTFIGEPIETQHGVTVIPVSRVSIAFATGGVDYGARRMISTQNFGGGGGTGVTITPIGFLTVSPDASVQMVRTTDSNVSNVINKVSSLIEHMPDLLQKMKQALF